MEVQIWRSEDQGIATGKNGLQLTMISWGCYAEGGSLAGGVNSREAHDSHDEEVAHAHVALGMECTSHIDEIQRVTNLENHMRLYGRRNQAFLHIQTMSPDCGDAEGEGGDLITKLT
ncbi:hypothetical protein ACJX0J_007558, partial [Zea mays]